MNEKALDVLGAYGLEARRHYRGRGGLIVLTGQGCKLLYECTKSDGYYQREHEITVRLDAMGYEYLDTYFPSLDGGLFAEGAQGRRYILKNWMEGRECDINSRADVLEGARTLARLHSALLGLMKEEPCLEQTVDDTQEAGDAGCAQGLASMLKYSNGDDLRMQFDKHTKEMRMVANYLKGKKNKNDFELLLYRQIMHHQEQAQEAAEQLGKIGYGERLAAARGSLELCHGSYNHHNLVMLGGGSMVTNLEKAAVDCQVTDLYRYLRKVMEKNGWDMALGQQVLEAYTRVRPLSGIDGKLLAVNFIYPEKFWKILNYYHGSNKSWFPRKNLEKLEALVEQDGKRQMFVETLHL